jgi:hypothetical protein
MHARVEVAQVDEPVLSDKVDDAMLLRHLHGDVELVCRLGREVDVDILLGERGVGRLVVNFDDVQLGTG